MVELIKFYDYHPFSKCTIKTCKHRKKIENKHKTLSLYMRTSSFCYNVFIFWTNVDTCWGIDLQSKQLKSFCFERCEDLILLKRHWHLITLEMIFSPFLKPLCSLFFHMAIWVFCLRDYKIFWILLYVLLHQFVYLSVAFCFTDVGPLPEPLSRQLLLVSTAHIHWDPEFCDVKLIQTMMLMWELQQFVEEACRKHPMNTPGPYDCNSIPLVFCGDLNSLPDSGWFA
jgi:hypothetical protein